MRILVTGASGLLGLNLALAASRDHQVFGQVHSHPLNVDAFQVIQADLHAPNAVQRLLDDTQPNWVIHCAAMANLDACEADPARAKKLNSEIPAELATYVGRGGARLVHVSTDAVFDGRDGDYDETDTPNPLSHYARTKLAAEQSVAAANPRAIIARVNFFGWSLSGSRSLGEFFFYNLQARKPVRGFTDVTFCPLLVNDLAIILLKMLEKELSGIYHVVSSEHLTKYDFGVRIARRFGLDESLISPAMVADGGLLAARANNLSLRTEKLSKALGESLPAVSPAIDRFYALYQQGYPQKLQQLRKL